MAKGEVPIAYIIALILGIAVVALLGYWFFVMQSGGSSELNAEQCRARAYEYCRTWERNQYSGADADIPNVGWLIGNKWFAIPSKGGDSSSTYAVQCAKYTLLSGDGVKTSTLKASCEALLK